MVYSNYQFSNNNYRNQYAGQSQSFRGSYGNRSNNSSTFGGALTEKEEKALTDCYVSSPSESVLGAAGGGVVFGLINNPRLVVHPIQSIKATSPTDKMFKAVTENGSKLNQLWVNPETNDLMREAYFRMHKIEARNMRKMGAFRKRLDPEKYKELKEIMQKALDSGNKEEIAKATATLQNAYITDGWLARPFTKLADKVKGLMGQEVKPRTIDAAIADKAAIEKSTAELLQVGQDTTINGFMKKHASVKSAMGWAAFEMLIDLGNMKRAFAKDRENRENGIKTNYGMKQLGQTTVKGFGSGIGWGVGEALASFAFSKWGTKLGTKFRPSVGAGIGGVVGVVGGSVGMMIMGRITRALVGDNVGEKLAAQELTQTPEGQAQLLQGVYEKAKKGEASPEAVAALQKLVAQMQTTSQFVPQPKMQIHA